MTVIAPYIFEFFRKTKPEKIQDERMVEIMAFAAYFVIAGRITYRNQMQARYENDNVYSSNIRICLLRNNMILFIIDKYF